MMWHINIYILSEIPSETNFAAVHKLMNLILWLTVRQAYVPGFPRSLENAENIFDAWKNHGIWKIMKYHGISSDIKFDMKRLIFLFEIKILLYKFLEH